MLTVFSFVCFQAVACALCAVAIPWFFPELNIPVVFADVKRMEGQAGAVNTKEDDEAVVGTESHEEKR